MSEALDPFEEEILVVLARETDAPSREGTLWSRVAYCLAEPRGALRPSPVRKKANLERSFSVAYARAVKRLVKLDLVRFRSIRDGTPHPRWQLGYNLNQLRDRDLTLTDAGRARADALRAPTFVYCDVPAPPRRAPRPPRPVDTFTLTLPPAPDKGDT